MASTHTKTDEVLAAARKELEAVLAGDLAAAASRGSSSLEGRCSPCTKGELARSAGYCFAPKGIASAQRTGGIEFAEKRYGAEGRGLASASATSGEATVFRACRTPVEHPLNWKRRRK